MINEQDKQRIDWIRREAITVFELTKGYTPEQREQMGNMLSTMEEMVGYVMELTGSLSATAELERSEKLLQEYRNDATTLATLLDEIIGYIPFDAWPQLHEDLAKQGHTKDYLKALRDKYADRYRNV